MDKLKKQILFVLLISILLCSVQAIAAADVSDTGVNDDVFDLSNDIETVQADSNDEVLDAEPDGSFTDLANQIYSASGNNPTIELDRNYVFNSTSDTTWSSVVNHYDGYYINLNKNIIINGNGKTIDGKGIAALFKVTGPYTITLNDLTIVNCTAQRSSNGNYYGAVINAQNQAVKLNINNCIFTNNTANPTSTNSRAGVIYASGNNNAVVTIKDSTFKDNKAYQGSAIYMTNGTLSISNTEILENQAHNNTLDINQLDPEPGYPTTVFHGWWGTFTGKDNLINGIYVTPKLAVTFKDVTYLGADGKEITTSTVPAITNNEAGITINLIILDSNGRVERNITAVTNSTGGYLITAAQAHLDVGSFTAYAIHYEDKYYTTGRSKTMESFNSYMHNTNITNASVEGYAGDKVNVTFNVTTAVGNHHVQNGTVVVEINGEKYTATVSNGKAKVEIVLPEASGDFTVTYDATGTKYYWNSTGTLKVTIKEPVDTEITVSPQNITVGDDETVSFAIDPTEVTGTVSVVIKDADGNTVYTNDSVAIEDAEFTVSADVLPAGTYNVTVSFAGNKQYNPSEASETFTVSKKASTVTVTPKDIKVGDDETVTFTVTEDVTGTTVSVVIKDSNGNTVYENASVAIADGEFTVPADVLPAGTYNVTVSYEGDGVYNASEASKTFEVSKRNVIVTINPEQVTGEQGTTATVTITVTEEDGETPVTGGTVVYTINWEDKLGETHSITLGATLDENGQATQEVELSGEPGTYSATASYTDDSGKYNDGEAEGTAVVTESESDDNSTDDTPDDSTDDSTDDSSEETQGTASKSAAVETLATGNPIAMLVLVLLTLVSTISIRRQK